MSTKKKAPVKKAVPEETQEPQEELQNESTEVDSGKPRERKAQRVITILSEDDSDFLSQFSLPRSSVSRAVLVGCRAFLEQFAEKKDVTEQEIVDALTAKLK